MDGAAVEGQRLEHLKMKEHQFRETFLIDLSNPAITPSWLKADDAEHLRSSVEAHKLLDSEYQVRPSAVYIVLRCSHPNQAFPVHPQLSLRRECSCSN